MLMKLIMPTGVARTYALAKQPKSTNVDKYCLSLVTILPEAIKFIEFFTVSCGWGRHEPR